MTGRCRSGVVALLATALLGGGLSAQQVADSAFAPKLGAPAFAAGQGPHVALDAAHFNFHTVDGRYLTFARVLRSDGFVVDGSSQPFAAASLEGVDVLVVANALAEENRSGNWVLPNPSAFTPEEIQAVVAFVENGGGLLLIADHMPFPGAAHDLAAAFGFTLQNGFAMESRNPSDPMVFRRSDGSLAAGPITDALGDPLGAIDSVVTFTGSAFRPPRRALPLLTFRDDAVSLDPDTAWAFHDGTPRVDVGGWSQGAAMTVGRGRVAVFGEAAMFSAQLAGSDRLPMGMNAPVAAQNPRFLVRVVRWLSGNGAS